MIQGWYRMKSEQCEHQDNINAVQTMMKMKIQTDRHASPSINKNPLQDIQDNIMIH